MTEHLLPLALGLAALLVAATLVWLLSLRLDDTSVVDIFWGPFFLVQAIVYALVTPNRGFIGREVLLLVLVAVWSTRLATHIAGRNAGAPEDHRYTVMRRKVGAAWRWQSLPRVFWLQALLAWIIGVPLYAVMSGGPQGWSWLDAVAVVVWTIGFTFEALGDVQLTAFIRNPANRGHTMQSGLWSRHPPPELLRRRHPVVGVLAARRGSRRLVVDLRPDRDDLPHRPRLRRGHARTHDRAAARGLRGVHAPHVGLHPLVSQGPIGDPSDR